MRTLRPGDKQFPRYSKLFYSWSLAMALPVGLNAQTLRLVSEYITVELVTTISVMG